MSLGGSPGLVPSLIPCPGLAVAAPSCREPVRSLELAAGSCWPAGGMHLSGEDRRRVGTPCPVVPPCWPPLLAPLPRWPLPMLDPRPASVTGWEWPRGSGRRTGRQGCPADGSLPSLPNPPKSGTLPALWKIPWKAPLNGGV